MGKLPKIVGSLGQCIPGARKLFVGVDGTFYMCEKVGEIFPIGDVNKGFYFDVIISFLKKWSDFFKERCYNCWAIRLCKKCFNDIRKGDKIDRKRFKPICEFEKKKLLNAMKDYCAIREINNNAFDFLDDMTIS